MWDVRGENGWARRVVWWCIIMACLAVMIPARAQDPAVCPANALLSYVRAGAVCQEVGRDEICYGNGDVQASLRGEFAADFTTPGARIPARETERITVRTVSLDQPDYAVATMQLRADITDPEQREVAVLVFGNADVTNLVPRTEEFPVVARGTLNIRQQPDPQADILEQIFVRESVVAHGRNAEGTWLRVTLPGSLELGWVSAAVGVPEGDINTLPVVDNDTPFLRPFQVMGIRTGGDTALCGADVVDRGVLLQTPNPEDQVSLTINGAEMGIAGTVYIEADDTQTRISVLEGIVNVAGVGFAPGGSEITPDGDGAMPLANPARLQSLPVNNLPTRVQIPAPLDADGIDAAIAVYNAQPPTPIPTATIPANICRYTVRRNNTPLLAGPGGFYETINSVNAGIELTPILQNTDADGVVWYQLNNSNWIAASALAQSGECNPIPVTDFVPAPRTNTVTMETCETSNGPLREGQLVTFEFRPPGSESREEMVQAPTWDPGYIGVASESLRVRVSEPIRIGAEPADKWVRVYSATWEAQAGTYRVESRRLSYILICNLTVRAG